MATRKEKVDAGLFLLIGVLLLAGTIAIVAGLNLEREGDLYLIKIPKSVGGLREGAAVKYLGVNVGRVSTVDFPAEDVESVRVRIEITRPSTPIKSGTFATLSSNFLTGESSVELQGGSNEDRRLVPGSVILWRPTTIMRIEDALPGVLDELKRVVASVNALVGDDNRQRVAKLIDDVDSLALELRAQLEPIRNDVHALSQSLADAGARIAEAASGLKVDVTASVGSGVADLKAAAKSIEAVSNKLANVVEKLDEGAGHVPELANSIQRVATRLERLLASADVLVEENRDGVQRALAQFEDAARQLETLLDQLERNPSDLIFSAPPEERERGAAPAAKPAKGGS